jgi:hypothetical protein
VTAAVVLVAVGFAVGCTTWWYFARRFLGTLRSERFT